MAYRIVPRTEIGLPATVTSSGGSPRRHLSGMGWLTYHYTGVDARYKDKDVPAEIRKIQQMFATSKPFEYNYVIGQTDDNNVYEFAGEYQAAHCKNYNTKSIGVLFLNGTKEGLTEGQIKKFQWLRAQLGSMGTITGSAKVTPHREMPEAATACPGQLILDVRGRLVEPFDGVSGPAPKPEPEKPAPKPPKPEGPVEGVENVDPVAWYIVKGDSPWSVATVAYGSGSKHTELEASAFKSYSTKSKPVFVDVPGVKGTRTQVESGEGAAAVIRRLVGSDAYPSKALFDTFYAWNGGEKRTLVAGAVVNMPKA